MDNYKIAFIHGENFENKGLSDGSIELYGDITKDSLHVAYLLDYAKKRFSDIPIFDRLTIRHQPEIVAYFLTKLGIIVFFNMTKYEENHIKRYGKNGMLMLPETLTEKQKEALKKLAADISDFNISINYDLTLDGILDSKTIQGFNHETPSELIEIYLKRIEEKYQERIV